MIAWIQLLADFEATGPDPERRAAFGRACHDCSHLVVEVRVVLLRRAFGL